MPVPIDTILLVSAVVLILAIVAARIGARVGLPSLLLFLGLGMALGDSGFGIPFDDPYLAKALAFAALVVILAEGGLTTKWTDIRSSTALAAVLATVGVGVSVALMTLFGYYVLDLDLRIAILLGAVTSPTDAAAVFSVLRRVPIPQRLRGALEAESGLNDAPTVLLVTLASAAAAGQPHRGPARFWSASSWSNSSVVSPSASGSAGSASRSSAGSRCRRPGSTRWPRWSGRCSRTA